MADGGSGDRGTIPKTVPTEQRFETLAYGDLSRGEILGSGGTATVSRATVDGDPERVVALKEPHVPADVPETLVERFRSEAETWGAIDDHPHVVTVHGWGTDPHPWLALEYMDAGPVASVSGDCGVARGLWTGARVAASLEHAHDAGVAHLDLTPRNVLLRETPGDGWPVPGVADWGLARALARETVNIGGLSPRYAAPEQFDPDRFGQPGAATDVYQLGVVLYELLVGSPPFDGPPVVVRDAVVEEPPPPASGRSPDLPTGIDDVLDRALAKDPQERYETVGGFRAELARALSDRTGIEMSDDEARIGRIGHPGTLEPGNCRSVTTPYRRALTLADEGFVQLSEGYFARREPASHLEAWRRGVTLADVRTGRAVERTVPEADGDDRGSLTDRLLDGLTGGTDYVLIGPPGSGKSTICKQVACEWFDRGHGPVFYREGGRDERFEDPDGLARQVSDADGHALVVVEDAPRPEANAVFPFLERVGDVGDVTVLLDARETEWREADAGTDQFGPDPVARSREVLEPVYVPRQDRREHERFVRAVERTADRPIEVDLEEFHGAVRQSVAGESGESTAGELFYLLHRLTALARGPLPDGAPTTLTDDVADVHDRLVAKGDRVLDVGRCVNALNAAGVGVHPELLYAVVPGEPLAVDDALEVLEGRVVFPRETDWGDGSTAYPAVHEAWSTAFLVHTLDAEGEADAGQRFGRVLTRILSLANDRELREQVRGFLGGDAPYVDRIERHPEGWADDVVESVYALGRERPKVARLFGDGRDDTITLPAACSDETVLQRRVWLGRLFEAGGELDRAERAFRRVLAAHPDAVYEGLLGLATVSSDRGEARDAVSHAEACLALADEDDRLVRARAERLLGIAHNSLDDYEASRSHLEAARSGFKASGARRWTARTLNSLGVLADVRGDYDRAREFYQRSLELFSELGDRHGQADALHNVGEIAQQTGEYDRAREYYERSLELERALGDRNGVATTLGSLAGLARREGDYESAREYAERTLDVKRDLGDRKGEAVTLNKLGILAYLQGEFERSRECFQQYLAITRDLGDRRGQSDALGNLAKVLVRQGDYEQARERVETSLAVQRDLGDREGQTVSYDVLGRIAHRRADYDRARDCFRQGLDIARDLEDRRSAAKKLDNLGATARKQGRYDSAREHLERSLDRKRDLGERPEEARTLAVLGSVAVQRGEYGRARDHLERALALAKDVGDRDVLSSVRYWLGDLCRLEGDYERASEMLAAALESDDGPFETARVRLARARLAFARGDVGEAQERGASARDSFDELGASHWRGRTLRLLGRLAAAQSDHGAASVHWRAALETFEAVGAPQDALATLQHLLETCRETGEGAAADRWCERARDLLDGAPAPVADRYRGWFRASCENDDA